DPETAAALMKAGALEFLTKDSLTAERLEQAIRSAIRVCRAERAAHENRERLTATLRSIADAVLTIDRNGRVIYLNHSAEALTGRASAAAAGVPLAELLEAVDADGGSRRTLSERIRAVIAGATDQERIEIALTTSGRTFFADVTAAPLCDANGQVNGAVVAIRDI